MFLRNIFIALACIFYPITHFSQSLFTPNNTIPVQKSSVNLPFAWMGGLNAPQFSEIDLNNDGFKDIFIFERATNKIHTFLNNGISNQVGYTYAPQYISGFPDIMTTAVTKVGSWVLLRDYNMDGKPDFFIGQPGSFWAFKNTSTSTTLSFKLEKKPIYATYTSGSSPAYTAQMDMADMADIDNDGDLDVLAWDVLGIAIYWYKNKSMDLYGHADSLVFDAVGCWGNIGQNGDGSLLLNAFSSGCPVLKTGKTEHSGSTLMLINLDADGDLDLLSGSISLDHIGSAINGGSASSANFTSTTTSYPMMNPYYDNVFVASYYLDINNDNVKDLIVATNETAFSAILNNKNGVWAYLNVGTNTNPNFNVAPITGFLQKEMIDVGGSSKPIFFDYDADNKLDLLVANEGDDNGSGLVLGGLTLYRNAGSATNPSYVWITDNYANIKNDTLRHIDAAFGDLDSDGDLDLIIGHQTGNFCYYQNTAGAGNPATFAAPIKNAFGGIDVGSFATPCLHDMDGDGKLDLIAGNQNGKVQYFRNKGTASVPSFVLEDTQLGDISVRKFGYGSSAYANPIVVDFNKNNNYDLLVGSYSGYLYYYPDIQGSITTSYTHSTFTNIDSTFQNIHEGAYVAPAVMDWNNDTYSDLALGFVTGGLRMYDNNGILSTFSNLEKNPLSWKVYPNPAQHWIQIEYAQAPKTTHELVLKDLLGRTAASLTVYPQQTTYNLVVSSLENGVYFLQDNQQTLKIVLQK